MLKFNVPPYIGTELEFITSAIQNHKICGDGPFTQKCNQWLKESTGVEKVLLTTSCTHALEMSAVLSEIENYHAFLYLCLHCKRLCHERG